MPIEKWLSANKELPATNTRASKLGFHFVFSSFAAHFNAAYTSEKGTLAANLDLLKILKVSRDGF
jgi:hypothetical protein